MEASDETDIEEELRKLLDDAYISDSQKAIPKVNPRDDFDMAVQSIAKDDDNDDGEPGDE